MDSNQQAILDLVTNYSACGYPLDMRQIHKMVAIPISEATLKEQLESLVREKRIEIDHAEGWYTENKHTIHFAYRRERTHISANKLQRVSKYLRLLRALPWIDLILLTGSCAIGNAKVSDDVDLMVVTRPHTMFICRMYSYLLSRALGVGRRRGAGDQPDKICTNIWLDGSDLSVPQAKMNTYSAREIVNATILFDRNAIYDQFVSCNGWIFRSLPNLHQSSPQNSLSFGSSVWWLKILNTLLGHLQLWYMRPHITQEIVGMTQLWLHPRLHQ